MVGGNEDQVLASTALDSARRVRTRVSNERILHHVRFFSVRRDRSQAIFRIDLRLEQVIRQSIRVSHCVNRLRADGTKLFT